MIVTDDRVAKFVGEKLDTIIYPPFTAMGLEKNGNVVAGVIFNCYTGPSIELTVAGKGWTRKFFREVGSYVFRQLKCARMQFITEDDGVAKLAERLGGKREGILRDRYGKGRDGIMISVLEQEYRF